MRPVMVVILFPLLGQPLRSGQALKHLQRQELVPEPAVEALGVAVLPRTSRLDVQRLDIHPTQPAPDCSRDELGAVVRADTLRHAAHPKQLGQRVDHILARDAASHLQGQTFARILIHDRQPLELAPARRVIEHKVPAPHVISVLRSAMNTAVLTLPESSLFPLFYRHFQPFPTPQTIDTCVARSPSVSPKPPGDSAVTPPRTSPRDLQHALGQGQLIVPWLRLVTLRAARLLQRLTRPPLGYRELLLKVCGRRAPPRRAHQFFSATCLSIRLSSVSSATSSFNRLFSSSSSFKRFASSDFIPPYWLRHRKYVASLFSRNCSTAATSLPALSIASASRSFRTISSGPRHLLRLPASKVSLPSGLREPL